MTGVPIYNVNNNCSTGSSALHLAKNLVEGGVYDCVLALGFEKMEKGSLQMKYPDRTMPLDKCIMKSMELMPTEGNPPFAPRLFGNAGIEHMKLFGTKPEHFAKVAAKNHKHSLNNPYSQFQKGYSVEDVLKSPKIHGVLTKLQCCPTSDGAGAAIVCSEEFVKKHGLEDQAVEIVAMELTTDQPQMFNDNRELVGYSMSKLAAEKSTFVVMKFTKRAESLQRKSESSNSTIVSVPTNSSLTKQSNSAIKEKPANLSIKVITLTEEESLSIHQEVLRARDILWERPVWPNAQNLIGNSEESLERDK